MGATGGRSATRAAVAFLLACGFVSALAGSASAEWRAPRPGERLPRQRSRRRHRRRRDPDSGSGPKPRRGTGAPDCQALPRAGRRQLDGGESRALRQHGGIRVRHQRRRAGHLAGRLRERQTDDLGRLRARGRVWAAPPNSTTRTRTPSGRCRRSTPRAGRRGVDAAEQAPICSGPTNSYTATTATGSWPAAPSLLSPVALPDPQIESPVAGLRLRQLRSRHPGAARSYPTAPRSRPGKTPTAPTTSTAPTKPAARRQRSGVGAVRGQGGDAGRDDGRHPADRPPAGARRRR